MENKSYRILEEIDQEIEFMLLKKKVALNFVEALKTKVEEIKSNWLKYGIIEIDTHNIYFTGFDNKSIGNSICNVKVTFNKEYSDLQVERMCKLINIKSYSFPGIKRESKFNSIGRFIDKSNIVTFTLRF